MESNMVTIPCDKLKEMQAEIATLTAKLAESEKQLAEAMKDALEKAAKVCEDFKGAHRAGAFNTELDRCAAAIRAMKEEL